LRHQKITCWRLLVFSLLAIIPWLSTATENRPTVGNILVGVLYIFGSDLRKIVLHPDAVPLLRILLHERGYRYHLVFPSLSSISSSILETQELFGRGQHEYAENLSNKDVSIVSKDGRFTIKSAIDVDSEDKEKES